MKALILGIAGQDGSYLAEQLTAAGHLVCGMTRRPSTSPTLIQGDLLDQGSLENALLWSQPDVVFNLAAVTAPGGAWGTVQPPLLADVTGMGVVRLLDAMVAVAPHARLVHASSSAIYDPHRYGLYGAAKVFAHQAVQGYRARLHCSNAILFSHTSPRQDGRFLAPRICSTLKRIKAGSDEKLVLGDVESRRDWGYAPDYMTVLTAIAEDAPPGDYPVATGIQHSVRELVETALKHLDLGWDDVVRIDRSAPRVPDEQPARVEVRLTSFDDMIGHMLVDTDELRRPR